MSRFFLLSLSLFTLLSASAQSDTLSRFYTQNRGLQIDRIEREHFPLDGDEVSMIPFRQDSLFGFVEREAPHDMLIEPQYLEVLSVHPIGAVVMNEEEDYGMVNELGEWIMPPYFHQIFRENRVYHGMNFWINDTIQRPDEYYNSVTLNYYVDATGEELFTELTHDAGTFTSVDTLAWFRYGTNYRIRDIQGRLVKEFKYDEAKEFVGINNNRLIFQTKTSDDWDFDYTYTGYTLEEEIAFSFTCGYDLEQIVELSPGFFATSSNDGHWDFRDANGKQFMYEYIHDEITYLYQSPDIYQMEYFPVVRPYGYDFGREMGLINRKGEEVIEIIYRYVDEPVDGVSFRLSHESNGLGQFVDTSGQLVVNKLLHSDQLLEQFQAYGKPLGFYDGLLPVTEFAIERIDTLANGELEYWASDKQFYAYANIQLEPEIVLDTTIIFAGLFSEGLAPVVNDEGELGFIDKKGEMVIEPAYELAVGGSYPIPYLVIPEFRGGLAYIKAYKGYVDKNGKAFFAGEQLKDHYDFSH